MARYEYPQECPVFRVAWGEVHEMTIHADHELESTSGWVAGVCVCVPLTISAVLMYEACGGTLETALEACSSRRGRKPDRLFARAHAYQAMKTELGEGC